MTDQIIDTKQDKDKLNTNQIQSSQDINQNLSKINQDELTDTTKPDRLYRFLILKSVKSIRKYKINSSQFLGIIKKQTK